MLQEKMPTLCAVVSKIRYIFFRNWKWALLFILMPTFNGCLPSVGYPAPLPIGIIDYWIASISHIDIGELIIIVGKFVIINFVLGIFLFQILRQRPLFLWVFVIYFLYEGVIALVTQFILPIGTYGENFLWGFYTLSHWSLSIVGRFIPDLANSIEMGRSFREFILVLSGLLTFSFLWLVSRKIVYPVAKKMGSQKPWILPFEIPKRREKALNSHCFLEIKSSFREKILLRTLFYVPIVLICFGAATLLLMNIFIDGDSVLWLAAIAFSVVGCLVLFLLICRIQKRITTKYLCIEHEIVALHKVLFWTKEDRVAYTDISRVSLLDGKNGTTDILLSKNSIPLLFIPSVLDPEKIQKLIQQKLSNSINNKETIAIIQTCLQKNMTKEQIVDLAVKAGIGEQQVKTILESNSIY